MLPLNNFTVAWPSLWTIKRQAERQEAELEVNYAVFKPEFSWHWCNERGRAYTGGYIYLGEKTMKCTLLNIVRDLGFKLFSLENKSVGHGHMQNSAGSLVAEDVGVEVADAVGCQECGNESKRSNDQNDSVVQVTIGHSEVSGPSVA